MDDLSWPPGCTFISAKIPQHSLTALRQSYIRKAIEYIPEEQRNSSLDQEILLLFQEESDINLYSQLLQLIEYLSLEYRSIVVMKSILQLFEKSRYMHRSHVVKLISYIPKNQRTVESIQEMMLFFQQVASGSCRYDIFHAIKKIPKNQRYEIIHLVGKIILGSEDWLLISKRVSELIEAIYRIDPLKRAEVSNCCLQYPIIFLQENIFSSICFFCPTVLEILEK